MSDQDESLEQEQQEPPTYRVIQKGVIVNIEVSDLESLVTHHPGSNRNATLEDGVPVQVEDPQRRSYGVIGGEIQEIEMRRTDGGTRSSLGEHQVLMIKDFMLEDSRIVSGGQGVRDVDVPSPIAGYVGRVNAQQGLVDIYDRQGGELIARVRHLNPIAVEEGDTIGYGQPLGTQNRQGLPGSAGKHVHLEMDTRYHQQYENYIADLTSGRLTLDGSQRPQGIEPLAVIDDGAYRIGESGDRVRDLQRLLADEGYRGRDGQPIEQDGIYRLGMQPAVLAFQRDHNVPQTGDIDSATLNLVPMPARREVDRPDHMDMRNGPAIPRIPGSNGPPTHEHEAAVLMPANFAPVRELPSDLRDPTHPGHQSYKVALDHVQRMESANGIASGPHSEQMAAAVAIATARDQLKVQRLELHSNGQVSAVERGAYPQFDERRVPINTRQALSQSHDQYASQWLEARSIHYAAPAMERNRDQSQALAQLSPSDQALFARIRRDVPASVSDDHVAQATLAAKREGIGNAEEVGRVMMVGDKLWVASHTPGLRVPVDVSQPASALHETAQQSKDFNQQQEMQLAQHTQQRSQNEAVHGMRMA
jgi:hypothetical protein